jgi:hypothetical protein
MQCFDRSSSRVRLSGREQALTTALNAGGRFTTFFFSIPEENLIDGTASIKGTAKIISLASTDTKTKAGDSGLGT